jgi:hypothetical protein
MEFLVVTLLNGVSYGLLLFMLASGLTLIFSMMGVLNFAHASFYMLGAYVAYDVSAHAGFWMGLVAAPLVVGGLGALVERYVPSGWLTSFWRWSSSSGVGSQFSTRRPRGSTVRCSLSSIPPFPVTARS